MVARKEYLKVSFFSALRKCKNFSECINLFSRMLYVIDTLRHSRHRTFPPKAFCALIHPALYVFILLKLGNENTGEKVTRPLSLFLSAVLRKSNHLSLTE